MFVRKFLALALRQAGRGCFKAARWTYLGPQERRVMPWIRDRGDQTLRLAYDDLNEASVVIDAGGYEGQWSSDLFSKYCCFIHIFEPVARHADYIQKRFARNAKIRVHRLALGAKNTAAPMAVARDGSSLFKGGPDVQWIEVVRAVEYFEAEGIDRLDLVKINIEGAEYDLLEHLIQSDFIGRISNIQVQFHDFVPDAESRMKEIQKRLLETHALTYQYAFVWENWRLLRGMQA